MVTLSLGYYQSLVAPPSRDQGILHHQRDLQEPQPVGPLRQPQDWSLRPRMGGRCPVSSTVPAVTP